VFRIDTIFRYAPQKETRSCGMAQRAHLNAAAKPSHVASHAAVKLQRGDVS
jgi:hypothetical protein